MQEYISSLTSESNKEKGRFSYCKKGGVRIFTIDAFANVFTRNTNGEHCPGWLLRSSPTTAYRLEDVPGNDWRIWTGDAQDGVVSVPSFLSVSCNDCQSAVDCNYHDTCDTSSSNL